MSHHDGTPSLQSSIPNLDMLIMRRSSISVTNKLSTGRPAAPATTTTNWAYDLTADDMTMPTPTLAPAPILTPTPALEPVPYAARTFLSQGRSNGPDKPTASTTSTTSTPRQSKKRKAQIAAAIPSPVSPSSSQLRDAIEAELKREEIESKASSLSITDILGEDAGDLFSISSDFSSTEIPDQLGPKATPRKRKASPTTTSTLPPHPLPLLLKKQRTSKSVTSDISSGQDDELDAFVRETASALSRAMDEKHNDGSSVELLTSPRAEKRQRVKPAFVSEVRVVPPIQLAGRQRGREKRPEQKERVTVDRIPPGSLHSPPIGTAEEDSGSSGVSISLSDIIEPMESYVPSDEIDLFRDLEEEVSPKPDYCCLCEDAMVKNSNFASIFATMVSVFKEHFLTKDTVKLCTIEQTIYERRIRKFTKHKYPMSRRMFYKHFTEHSFDATIQSVNNAKTLSEGLRVLKDNGLFSKKMGQKKQVDRANWMLALKLMDQQGKQMAKISDADAATAERNGAGGAPKAPGGGGKGK